MSISFNRIFIVLEILTFLKQSWWGVRPRLESKWTSIFKIIRTQAMDQQPYDLFDIDKGTDKLFFIGTTFIVLFLFLL